MKTGWLFAGLAPQMTTRSLWRTSVNEQVGRRHAHGGLEAERRRRVADPRCGVDGGDAHGAGGLPGHVVGLVREAAAGQVDMPTRAGSVGRRRAQSSPSASSQGMTLNPRSPRRRSIGWPSRPSSRHLGGARRLDDRRIGQQGGIERIHGVELEHPQSRGAQVDPVDRPIVQPGHPEGTTVAGTSGQYIPRVLGVSPVVPRHLDHLAVVVRLLFAGAVRGEPRPELGRDPQRSSAGSIGCGHGAGE